MDKSEKVFEIESKFIKEKENEILNKAKNVSQELQELRNQKIDLLVQVFKEQLQKDVESDIQGYNNKLGQQFMQNIKELDQSKNLKTSEIDKMINNIQEQVKTFQMMIDDLRDKKDEIEGSYEAALEYLKKEKLRNLDEYRYKCDKVVNIKIKEFRTQIAKGNTFN